MAESIKEKMAKAVATNKAAQETRTQRVAETQTKISATSAAKAKIK